MLQYPSIRMNLLRVLLSFSDLEYQKTIWLDPELRHQDNFYFASENLLDDFIWEYGEEVGVFLRNSEEQEACLFLVEKVTQIVKKHKFKNDMDYLNLPEWNEVISAARHALRVLNKGDA